MTDGLRAVGTEDRRTAREQQPEGAAVPRREGMSNIFIPAISLWQPWAWLLVHGHEHANGKRVENRGWPLPTGPSGMAGAWCLIHAAKAGCQMVPPRYHCPTPNPNDSPRYFGWPDSTCLVAAMTAAANAGLEVCPRVGDVMQCGGIVGAVRWDGYCDRQNGTWSTMSRICDLKDATPRLRYWFGDTRYLWFTMDARPLPFVPWRGRQGFFRVPLAELPAEYQWLGETP